jgi:hypothetical protein
MTTASPLGKQTPVRHSCGACRPAWILHEYPGWVQKATIERWVMSAGELFAKRGSVLARLACETHHQVRPADSTHPCLLLVACVEWCFAVEDWLPGVN